MLELSLLSFHSIFMFVIASNCQFVVSIYCSRFVYIRNYFYIFTSNIIAKFDTALSNKFLTFISSFFHYNSPCIHFASFSNETTKERNPVNLFTYFFYELSLVLLSMFGLSSILSSIILIDVIGVFYLVWYICKELLDSLFLSHYFQQFLS